MDSCTTSGVCIGEAGAGITLDGTGTDFAGFSLSEHCDDTMDCEVAAFGTSGLALDGMKLACVTLNGHSGGIEGLAGSAETSLASSGMDTELTGVSSYGLCCRVDGITGGAADVSLRGVDSELNVVIPSIHSNDATCKFKGLNSTESRLDTEGSEGDEDEADDSWGIE